MRKVFMLAGLLGILAILLGGCSGFLGFQDKPSPEAKASTAARLAECRNGCPKGSKAMLLKGGGGDHGLLDLCGCLDDRPIEME